jgi:hypothetical protein
MLTNCLGSEFAVTEQMCLVSANVVGSELLDRLTTMPGKVIDDSQVILDRNFGAGVRLAPSDVTGSQRTSFSVTTLLRSTCAL